MTGDLIRVGCLALQPLYRLERTLRDTKLNIAGKRGLLGTLKHVTAVGIVLIGLAIATPAHAQGYSLNSASLGTNQITITIPKSGTVQSVHMLRLHYSGRGANCNTGGLSDNWWANSNIARPLNTPAGVTMGYSHNAMSLPSSTSRGIVINVASTAAPTTLNMALIVPRGQCGGNNQAASVTFKLVKAP